MAQRVLRQRRGRSDHRQRGVGQPDRGDSLGPDGPGPAGLGEGDLISGNANVGIELSGIGTSGNVVAGDLIGTLTGGINALGNGQQGVEIDSGASNNTIGGTGAAARDVISGNGWDAVHIIDPGTTGNVVEGDYLGVAADGEVPLGNVAAGWPSTAGRAGTWSAVWPPGRGTSSPPIMASASTSPTRARRTTWWLVTTSAPTPPARTLWGTGSTGVYIQSGASDNTIGGTTAAAHDVISGNGWNAIDLAHAGTTGNVVEGDYLGVTADGTRPLDNVASGVAIWDGAAATRSAGRWPARATSSPPTWPSAFISPIRGRSVTLWKGT